jgi:HAD superfamily hydrolase (TIGR01509 family)
MGQELEAVLFDMDGTLVETEQFWGEAMFELAGQLGGEMSAEARARTVGTSMRTAMQVLHADLGVQRDEEQLRADGRWVEERTRELMSRGTTWRPGARELVAAVRADGLATALVTTTPRRIAQVVLDEITADLGEDPFDVTVCGDEVPARKPDPAPYRQAMAALGVAPETCVAIEDSIAGASSALAAGAVVLGVPGMQPLPPLAGLVLRDTLAGLRPADLAALLRRRPAGPAEDPAA